jgi:G3E family GTPase
MKVKTYIISGFLGCGKTELVNKIISDYPDSRIVVIENEVAEFGVDGKISSSKNVKVIEINDGCISNVNLNNLKRTIKSSLKKFKPEIIIIEASGAASLNNILIMLEEFNNLDKYGITIVDISRFCKAKKLSTYTLEHIANASLVIVNKCDLVSSEIKEKQLKNIKLINSNVIDAVKSDVNLRILNLDNIKADTKFKEKKLPYILWKIKNNLGLKHSKTENHCNINAFVYESYGVIKLDCLKNFFMKNHFPRAKGFVYLEDKKLYYFNVIDDVFNIELAPIQHFNHGELNRIVLIGRNVYHNRRLFRRKLNKCVNKTIVNIMQNLYWILKNQQTLPERVVYLE